MPKIFDRFFPFLYSWHTAYHEGRAAAKAGVKITDCPYCNTELVHNWSDGWFSVILDKS